MKWPILLANGWHRIEGVLLMVAVTGCVSLPQYDDQTDKLISHLQTDVDKQIIALITLDHKIDSLSSKTDAASQKALADLKIKAGYDANTSFYENVDVDLISLQTRVDAEKSPATSYLDISIKDLRETLLGDEGSMQATHKEVDILSVTFLRNTQKLVDAQIGALLTRELGLKYGAATSGSSGAAASSSTKAAATPAVPK
jgi:hypothetical protein